MRDRRSPSRGLLLCGIAAVCFGAATPVSRRLLSGIDAVALAGLLYIGAACAAGPIAARQPRAVAARRDWARLGVAVVIGGGVSPVLLLLGLDRVPSPTVSILLNLELVATVVIAWALFRERVDARTIAGIALVLAAGVSLAWSSDATISPAALLVVAACVGWGLDNSTTANLTAFTPAQITTAKGLVAGPVNLTLGLVFFDSRHTTLPTIAGSLAIGAVGYGASIMLWIAGARTIGAARGQAIFAAAPFVGVALAWPIAGERLDARSGVAFVLAAAGVAIVSTTSVTRLHRHHARTHDHVHRHDDDHHTHAHGAGRLASEPHAHPHTHAEADHSHTRRHQLRHR